MDAFDLGRYIDFGPGESLGDAITSTPVDGHLLATGNDGQFATTLVIIAMTLFLLFWAIVRVPVRSGRTSVAAFRCPVQRVVVVAEFQFDPANRRRVDVIWCSAFSPAVGVRCKKRCLQMALSSAPLADETRERV